MKSLIYNTKLELTLGVFVILVCTCIHLHIKGKVAEATPKCDENTCTAEISNTPEYSLAALCDLADQSDSLMVSCILEHEDPHSKKECFEGVKIMDKEVLKLQTSYQKAFKDFPVCQNAFRNKWRKAK